jgi:mono/diheme cytochrome c family protein
MKPHPIKGLVAPIALGLVLCLAGGCASTPARTSTSPQRGGSPATRGPALYTADGCSGCHSLNGERLSGPSWKGLAGSRVTLSSGRTVLANDAYLTRHIVEPNALTVAGYPGEVMAEATDELHLASKPADVRALVAFIDSIR